MSHCAQCIVDISYIFWTLLIDAVPLGSGIRISSFWIECPTVRNASLTFHVFLELCWNARAHGDLLSLALTFPGLLWLSWNARAHGVLWLYLSCFDLAGALVGGGCASGLVQIASKIFQTIVSCWSRCFGELRSRVSTPTHFSTSKNLVVVGFLMFSPRTSSPPWPIGVGAVNPKWCCNWCRSWQRETRALADVDLGQKR